MRLPRFLGIESPDLNTMGAMHETAEDAIGPRGIADLFGPREIAEHTVLNLKMET